MADAMTLIEPVGRVPQSAAAAGFVPREAEEDLARNLFRPLLTGDRETMLLAGFDAYARLVGFEGIAGESSGRCVVTPQCWHRLLDRRIASVVMAHNHPSGIARPSDADLRCTRESAQFLRLIGIDLSDHLIFVESGHFSFFHAQLI